MTALPPSTRRANRWLFIALVTFALALAVTCFVWMQGVVRKNGGIADPQPRKTSLVSPTIFHVATPDFALRSAVS